MVGSSHHGSYCHLCDADPCWCGQNGKVVPVQRKVVDRGGPRELDLAIREFVLSNHDAGVHENYTGWLDRLVERFGPERPSVRAAWNRVANQIQREWLPIDDPDVHREGPMMEPSHYPEVRRLTTAEAVAVVERLIADGGRSRGEPGLRLYQVWQRIPGVAYIAIYDALHDMNGRAYLVTTTAPSGKSSQFWYVR